MLTYGLKGSIVSILTIKQKGILFHEGCITKGFFVAATRVSLCSVSAGIVNISLDSMVILLPLNQTFGSKFCFWT